VGTEYFQSMKTMPYGYKDERNATREEWLRFLDDGGMSDEEDQ
jgi:hypothetical protein